MSTRANILITDAQGNESILYHHHDGYPEGVGRELQRILRHITDEIEAPESLVSFITLQDPNYEPTEGIHGDIDYLYTINTSTHELYYEKAVWEGAGIHFSVEKHPLCTYQPIIGTKDAPQRMLIQSYLSLIEEEHNIRILYAVESGSRAWGFSSPGSDFDVRFIYVHKPDWYFKVEPQKDVIERNIPEFNLDIVGWELRKTLSLFRKTNPSLLEWLHSPIIYTQRVDFIDAMWQLEPHLFNPIKAMHHYLSIAKGHDEHYLQKNGFTLKRFLYYLRGLLACVWIEKHLSAPPVLFEELIKATISEDNVLSEINHLLTLKRQSKEHDKSAVSPILINFTHDLMEHYQQLLPTFRPPLPTENVTHLLDRLLYSQSVRFGNAKKTPF